MMTRDPIFCLLAVAGLFGMPAAIQAHDVYDLGSPGSRLAVSVEIDGHEAPLYPAPDGSGRRYLEAREGASYAVRLENRTGERVGVVLMVDGLNAISGVQAIPYSWAPPGRMYVLDPWDSTTVRGWRTSLSEIRRFTFVDERSSYAARAGKASGKMGWIEVSVYRELRPLVRRPWEPRVRGDGPSSDEASRDGAGRPAPPAARTAPEAEPQADAKSAARAPLSESYPGTGWGRPTDDPVQVVSFDPQPRPSETVTLRYEYAPALRALGIALRPEWSRDRLRDRDGGVWGYAQPPAW
jgi:hypothetical protein